MTELTSNQRNEIAEQFAELVDNVTNETVLDINNTGGKY